jgi:hypothetical protein
MDRIVIVCGGGRLAKWQITIPGTGIACWQAGRSAGMPQVHLTFTPIDQGQKTYQFGSRRENIDA